MSASTSAAAPRATASASASTRPRERTQDRGNLNVISPKGDYGRPRLDLRNPALNGPIAPNVAQASAAPAPAPAPPPAPAVQQPILWHNWTPIDGMMPIFCEVVQFQPAPAQAVVQQDWVPPAFPFRPFKRVAVDRVPSLGVRVPAFKKNFRSCLTPGLVDRSCHGRLESI
jgi:hypothetical protein